MTPTPILTPNRRSFISGLSALAFAVVLPLPARAITVDEARALIDQLVGEVNVVINSGRSQNAMIREFEHIFARYGDVPVIARSVLGPAARQASRADLGAFTEAFQGYMARKYGRQFREFRGGRIEVTDARPVRNFFEVISTAYLPGEAPFEVRWHVSDRSGSDRFFNLLIAGVNLLATERTEIGAMLDRRRGDIAAMTADLRQAG
jgi:phospholipid transport system substrate-binding protein